MRTALPELKFNWVIFVIKAGERILDATAKRFQSGTPATYRGKHMGQQSVVLSLKKEGEAYRTQKI